MNALPIIDVLPPDLASQIAAGEVVERPASVVKELIENALDAEATRIEVTIEAGGLSLIEVADDGHGMSQEDAARSLERHATSKLRRFSDLEALSSYGFRGEALPSVASVSRLRIRTRARGSNEGVELRAEGTTTPEVAPVGHPVGTTLTVHDLFFNVPARRKFLRSSNTESGHVAEVVTDAALARPDVSFSLTRDGRRVRSFSRTTSRLQRAEQVFSGNELWQVEGERGPLRMEAHLCTPDRSQKGAGGLKLLVNGRPIRDRALSATIAHAFGSLLERGRYPRGVVYLTVPPRLVDVNVHPQKSEVRFAELRAVTDAVYGLVARAAGNKWLPSLEKAPLEEKSRVAFSGAPRASSIPPTQKSAGPDAWSRTSSPLDSTSVAPEPGVAAQSRTNPRMAVALPARRIQSLSSSTAPLESRVVRERPAAVDGSHFEVHELMRGGQKKTPKTWKNLRFLSQVRAMYLVCEGTDGIYVLDQHAADERVLFTRLKRGYEQSAVVSQALLFPLTVELTAQEVELLDERGAEISQLGLDVRVRSKQSVSIHAVPKLLQRSSPERLLQDVLTELSRASERGFSALVEKALSSMACHEAVRAGDRLSSSEAEALLVALDEADFEAPCAHGRPVVAVTTFKDLERKVGRR